MKYLASRLMQYNNNNNQNSKLQIFINSKTYLKKFFFPLERRKGDVSMGVSRRCPQAPRGPKKISGKRI